MNCKICGTQYSANGLPSGLCPECRFWCNVNKNAEHGCWLWTGKVNHDGYGFLSINLQKGKRERFAHRVSWLLSGGEIPHGKIVLHCCDVKYSRSDITNRRCVNPEHLRLGTQAENVTDCVSSGRIGRTFGDANGSRLYPERLARGDANWARMHPELVPRGENSSSRKHPEKLARGDNNGARKHPERLPRGESHYMSKLSDEQVFIIRNSKDTQKAIASAFGITQGYVSAIKTNRKRVPFNNGGANQ